MNLVALGVCFSIGDLLAGEATSGMDNVVKGTAITGKVGTLPRRRLPLCLVLELVGISPVEQSYQTFLRCGRW